MQCCTPHPREFDIAQLNNRTRLNLEYAGEKQKEIAQLEAAVATLRNTTGAKQTEIVRLGQVIGAGEIMGLHDTDADANADADAGVDVDHRGFEAK